MSDPYQALLIDALVRRLEWGEVSEWSGRDFSRLSEKIHEKTGTLLSESTLRRVTGKMTYPHLPSETTLDALAQFLGYPDFRSFRQAQLKPAVSSSTGAESISRSPTAIRTKGKPGFRYAYLFLPLLLLAFFISWLAHTKGRTGDSSSVYFRVRPLTHSLPNTVIFEYNAGNSRDSLYLQQSWDPHSQMAISPADHVVSSLYYRPGYYRAKLVQNKSILRETPLLISTHGWAGLIDQGARPPLYLDSAEFNFRDSLRVGFDVFGSRNLRPDLNPIWTELYNVGNFRPLAAKSLHGSFEIEGCNKAVACGHLAFFLLTNGMPISISLADTGCVAGIQLLDGQKLIDGSKYDLSGFGTKLQHWNLVDLRVEKHTMTIRVNGTEAYWGASPPDSLQILGVGFGFNGDGAVKNLQLSDSAGVAFHL